MDWMKFIVNGRCMSRRRIIGRCDVYNCVRSNAYDCSLTSINNNSKL